MTTEITYIAYDGARFTDEDACRDYEYELRKREVEKDIFFFDSYGSPMPIDSNGFFRTTILKCTTKVAAQFIYDEFGDRWVVPWEYREQADAGYWYYDNEDWCPVSDLIEKAKFLEILMAEGE